MHIADGIIPAGVCIAADTAVLAGIYLTGRRVRAEEVPRMGLMSAAVFTVSLINFPIAGSSVHLGLFGLAGILLGLRSFTVIFATLLFQSLIFQHGGLVSIGINTLNMASGALAGSLLWQLVKIPKPARAAAAGFLGIIIPTLLMAGEFRLSGYGRGVFYIIAVYLPVALIEGILTVTIVKFLDKVKPEIIGSKTK